MPIATGDFISLSYTGTVDGKIFDTTDEETAKDAGIHNPSALYGPVIICVGSHHVILGLDEEIEGKEAGHSGEVDIYPEKAFGEHDPKKVEAFNKNSFKEKPHRGMQIKVGEKGEGTVVDVIGNRVLIDFNHPFAGKNLHYTYTIEDIITDVKTRMLGLIKLYAGREMDLTFDAGVVTITLPAGINYDKRWIIWRSRIIHEAFQNIPDIGEITLVETFTRPESKEE